MPVLYKPIVIKTATLTFQDYTGSPLTYTAGNLELGSVAPIVEAAQRTFEAVYINSSTGGQLYATIDSGESAPMEFAPKFVAKDLKNNTDSTLRELLTGLYENNVTSQTGFASWVVTNPLTGGGKDTVKIVLTIRDNSNVSHVATFAVNCTTFTAETSGEHASFAPTFAIIGPITWS